MRSRPPTKVPPPSPSTSPVTTPDADRRSSTSSAKMPSPDKRHRSTSHFEGEVPEEIPLWSATLRCRVAQLSLCKNLPPIEEVTESSRRPDQESGAAEMA